MLGRSRIADHFDSAFFQANFWLMWCTTFAFQPWHGAAEFKRYLVRFAHMVDGFNRLLGSMTESSSLGAMTAAPVLPDKSQGGAWTLWERIAAGRPAFGNPSVFSDHISESKWVSFTATLHDPAFLRIVGELTGNVPGEGGLITFPDSGWLASIVIPYQPHFIGQPAGVSVFWGYGYRSTSREHS